MRAVHVLAIVAVAEFLAGCGKDPARRPPSPSTSTATAVPSAQPEIFDAHLHYNHGSPVKAASKPFYTLDEVADVFQKNGVTGALVQGTPNKGTRMLAEAKSSTWIVPFIRPYKSFADYDTWFDDNTTIALIESELQQGYYRGIGEFHVAGDNARTAVVKQVVDIAVKHDLVLHAHCDEAALHILFAHDPRVRIIWAHTGFDTQPERIEELLAKYNQLWCELSYQSGPTDGDGKITAGWSKLFEKRSDRFLVGSDTWVDERWEDYGGIMRTYRAWLQQLPADQARRIASENAGTIFGKR